MEIIRRRVDALVPYEKNAKKHDRRQIANVAESIRQYGFVQPVVIDRDGVIVIGHCRVLAAKKLGMAEVPCVSVDSLTPEQVRALRIADNKTNESAWDLELLAEELPEVDFSGFEFNFPKAVSFLASPSGVVDDDAPDVEEETVCRLGDIWQLGRHRLMCGDSTNADAVSVFMSEKRADMVMTDPPYGINANKMTMGSGKKEFHRGSDTWDKERPDISFVLELADSVCIWGGNYFADILPVTNDWLVWHKLNDGLSFSECELAWCNFGRNTRIIQHHWGNEKKLHVTMKPVSVIAWAIQQAKKQPETVLDLFGGSGTTMIACEQLGRTCYMMELDPKYCDVIIRRWESFTGGKAVRVN